MEKINKTDKKQKCRNLALNVVVGLAILAQFAFAMVIRPAASMAEVADPLPNCSSSYQGTPGTEQKCKDDVFGILPQLPQDKEIAVQIEIYDENNRLISTMNTQSLQGKPSLSYTMTEKPYVNDVYIRNGEASAYISQYTEGYSTYFYALSNDKDQADVYLNFKSSVATIKQKSSLNIEGKRPDQWMTINNISDKDPTKLIDILSVSVDSLTLMPVSLKIGETKEVGDLNGQKMKMTLTSIVSSFP